MHERDDNQLLAQYARDKSDEAFAALVARHINLVYSVAVRHVGNPDQAKDITQVVFLLLVRKAGSLSPRTLLPGWLYRTARLTAANYIRMENRRRHREQEVHMQSLVNESEPDAWTQVAPFLDAAMEHLGDRERNAVLLRFFEGKSLKEVGAVLGTTENTAQKSVERALKKLRSFLSKRGISLSSTTALAVALSLHSVQAAPAGLAESVITAGITNGATIGGQTLILMKSTLNMMAWLKMKMAISAGLSVILVAGTATVAVAQIQKNVMDHSRAAEFAAAGNPLSGGGTLPAHGTQASDSPSPSGANPSNGNRKAAGTDASQASESAVAPLTVTSAYGVGGLVLWLAADSGVTLDKDNGNGVAILTDKTGNFILTPEDAKQEPIYVPDGLNGKPVLRFNGRQSLYSPDDFGTALNHDMTFIIVAMTNDSPDREQFPLYLGQNSSPHVNRDVAYYKGEELFDGQFVACTGPTVATNAFVVMGSSINPSLTEATFYRNGRQLMVGSVSETNKKEHRTAAFEDLSGGVTMGAATDPVYGWRGDIAEELVYNHQLSPAEMQTVWVYLSHKYGLQAGANPPSASAPAAMKP